MTYTNRVVSTKVLHYGPRRYLVKTVNGQIWYARGKYTQEAEEAVALIVGKNKVVSCTPVPAYRS